MKTKLNLPYYRVPLKREDFLIFRFLKRKFLAPLKKRFLLHYLFAQDIRQYLNFIQKMGKKYPFFLVFDIEKYFPSISHQILLKVLPEIYQKISQKPISRRFKKILKKICLHFLQD